MRGGEEGGCNNQRAGSTRLAGKIVTAMKFNQLKFRRRVQTKTKVRSPKWNLAEGPIGRGEGRLPLGPPFKMAAADDQLASRTPRQEPVGSSVRAGEGWRVGCRGGGEGAYRGSGPRSSVFSWVSESGVDQDMRVGFLWACEATPDIVRRPASRAVGPRSHGNH